MKTNIKNEEEKAGYMSLEILPNGWERYMWNDMVRYRSGTWWSLEEEEYMEMKRQVIIDKL